MITFAVAIIALVALLFIFNNNYGFIRNVNWDLITQAYIPSWFFRLTGIPNPNSSASAQFVPQSVPVLLYYDIVDRYDGSNVTVQSFQQQMFALKQAGYNTITLNQFENFLSGEGTIPPKSFLLTFEDGKEDSYYPVDPILKSLNYTAVMFVTTDDAFKDNNGKTYLSASDLQSMISSGRWQVEADAESSDGDGFIAIDGNGTQGHFFSNEEWLPSEGRVETPAEYTQRITNDLEGAKADLQKYVNTTATAFAFPFGDTGAGTLNYPAASTTLPELVNAVYPVAFTQVNPADGFAQNYFGQAGFAKQIAVRPDWTPSSLIALIKAGSAKDLPFSDNFSGYNGWIGGWGNVEFQPNDVSIANYKGSTGGSIFLDGSQPWIDYSFNTDLDWISADTVTLYARYKDADDNENCSFSPSDTRVLEEENGTSTQLFESREPVPTSAVNLGMRVIDDKIECLVNGQVVAYSYGADPMLSSGGIGISIWSKTGNTAAITVKDVSASVYNTPQEYAQSYNVTGVGTSTRPSNIKITETAPVLTGPPPAPASTPLQNLGSASVLANWTAGASSTLAADTSLYTEGDQSLSLTTDGAGDNATAEVVNQGPYNLTNKYLEVWVRVSSTTNVHDLAIIASSDDLKDNYYRWNLGYQILDTSDESEIQAGEWVPIVLTFDADGDDTVMSGAPNIAALNSFELLVSDGGTGAPVTAWLGGISAVAEPSQAVLSIVFDNGWISEYTLAMPTLAKYGFPAVIAEIPETANDPSFMSTIQMQDLQNNLGWDIACHTWDHAYQLGLPTTTIAIMDSEFTQCQNWLNQNGFGKASNFLIWPDGSNSPTAIAEASKYFVAARGIVGAQFNTLPPANPMMLYSTELGGDTPTSTLDADVDRCEANHEWCIFYGHIITDTAATDQDEYASSSFNDFVAHVAQVGIPVKTITDVLANIPQLPAPSLASLQSPASLIPPPASAAPTATVAIAPTSTAPAPPTPPLQLPYIENNLAGESNWQDTWGTMTIDPSGFMDLSANASTTGSEAELENSSAWTDYNFATTFDWVKGQTVSLIARYTDSGDYVECEFNDETPGSVEIFLRQYIKGEEYDLSSAIASNDSGVGDTNANGSISVKSNEAACSFNNHVVSEYGTTLNPPFSGGIGFSTWDPTVNNSEIVVKSVTVTSNH